MVNTDLWKKELEEWRKASETDLHSSINIGGFEASLCNVGHCLCHVSGEVQLQELSTYTYVVFKKKGGGRR